MWCVGQIGPSPESQAAPPRPSAQSPWKPTIKDQMTSDFAFHLLEWVLKCRRWLLNSMLAVVEQHMGPGGCAGVPQATQIRDKASL